MDLQTMYLAKLGSPQTILAADLAADGTSMVVNDVSVLPAAPNILVIGSDENCEIVSYSAIDSSTNTVTISARGLGDSTAKAWASGATIARNHTSLDHNTLKGNIEALNTGKQDTYAQSASAWDTTPTASSTNPVTSGGIKTALDAKQNTLSWDTAPTASSTNPVTSGGIKTYTDQKILYFYNQSTSVTSAATTEFCNVSDSKITADTVVLNCEFTVPTAITSHPDWTSAAGYISLKGICTSSTCKVNLVLGQKGN